MLKYFYRNAWFYVIAVELYLLCKVYFLVGSTVTNEVHVSDRREKVHVRR